MVEDPFQECLRSFAAHDYESAANLSLNLLQQRRFHWLFQVMLISLQRAWNNDELLEAMGKTALDSFAEHAWETQLLRLTLEGQEIDSTTDRDPKATCQRLFYQASSLLTQGHRAAARPLFEAAARTLAQCAEFGLAEEEVSNPESRVLTLHRVLLRCQSARDGQRDLELKSADEENRPGETPPEIAQFQERRQAGIERLRELEDDFLHHAGLAVEILEEKPRTAQTSDELQQLQRLASGLGLWLQRSHVRHDARDLYDRLSRAPIAAGQVPPVPRRVAAGAPPLRRVRVALTQLATDRCSELARAAIAFGFPLFLGRHPLLASPEGPLHQWMRDSFKEGTEASPFCRRRFSGDTTAPLPRARYHAVCCPLGGDDGGTVVAEMMAYALPALTGYCAVRPAERGVELVFRGLPMEPNPFYLACRDPATVEHVFRGLPVGNPMHALSDLPPSDNLLAIPIAIATTEQQFGCCFDLRMPDTREWLSRFFANPPDGLHGDALRTLAEVHRFDLHTVSTWQDLLPVLIARTSGGNTLTDIVGTYLRTLGCDALIFPSARNDFHAAFENGSLVSASGWNLVDYRGLDPVDRVGLDVGNPIEQLYGPVELHESAEGSTQGSVELRGNVLTNRVMNQIAFEEFLMARGPRWVREHKPRELIVRGYLWYRKRYPRGDGGFLGICDQCETSFSDESAAVQSQCPSCGFQGD